MNTLNSELSNDMNPDVQLGKIVGVWGVRGWVKLHSYTRNRIEIGDYEQWRLKSSRQSSKSNDASSLYKVLACRQQGQGMAAQLEGVDSRDQAEALIGYTIWVKQSELPALDEDEYYWQQLIGLQVYRKLEGVEPALIGKVESILETGANDVLVVERQINARDDELQSSKSTSSEADTDLLKAKSVLIPYTTQVVLEVDLSRGVLLVDWDPEYLD